QVRGQLRKLRPRKAPGPDKVCPRLLKTCAAELGEPLQRIFNLSLQIGRVPTLWKTSRIVPVPKKNRPSELNDFRPVAPHFTSDEDVGAGSSSASSDPSPLCFGTNLEQDGSGPPADGLDLRLPHWQTTTSATTRELCHIQKYADDTAIVGCIRDDREEEYRRLVGDFAAWCHTNHLQLNTSKTKELVIDFGRSRPRPRPVLLEGAEVEAVDSYRYLGLWIDNKLDWTTHTSHLYGKTQSRMYFLRRLRSFNICSKLLQMFYQSVVASVLFYTVVCWGGSISKKDTSRLDKLIRRAGSVVGHEAGLSGDGGRVEDSGQTPGYYGQCQPPSAHRHQQPEEPVHLTGANEPSTNLQDMWWLFVVVAVVLVALLITVVVVIKRRRAKGNKSRMNGRVELTSNPAETRSAPETGQDTADPEDGVSYASISFTKKRNSKAKVRRKNDNDE
ncbi:hypothetical protein L3Q82_011340, partial [Scortum barcoo]